MHADLKYVESLEKEIDELESDKAKFSNMYDVILQQCVSNDVKCSYLMSLSDLDALDELQCLYLHKVKEFCNEKASNVFRKEREQYIKIQDLKAKLQVNNIAISELEKLIKRGKGKSVDTKFYKPSIVRQPIAQRIPKPSVLGKPAPFSNSLDIVYFPKTKSVLKANVSEGLSKPATTQTLPQTAKKAGNDLLTGNRGSDLYTISLQESTSSTPLCLMAKATLTQAWLWHRRLSHLNFDYINLLSKKDIVIGLPKLKYVKDELCSSCESSKAKRSSFKSKVVPSSKERLNLLHMDLCGPIRVASINGKKYILAEAIATACYTQNRSIIILTHSKTPYHIINDRKSLIKHLHIFGCICYITRDGENLDKMKEKGDPCLVPQRQKASDYDNSDPVPQRQDVSSSADANVPSQQELDLLFGPLYDGFVI
nr:retrovirus-related Pol polyprotein from transposon TNT 1-94 [Tanacetum cinerariifolium]